MALKVTRRTTRATLSLAIACVALVACGDDSSTTSTGGTATGGAGGATGGSGGAGGAAGSDATGGSAGSGGATGGSAGSGGATGGSAGSGGATGGSAGSGGTGGSAGSGGAGGGGDAGTPDPRMNFFVTSDVNKTGNLGGLTGADARCQRLAMAVGQGSKTWRAYLSTEAGDGGTAINAKDRIGPGPYYNSKGVLMAADSAALHAMNGNADLFIDESGQKIKGQWTGSGTPVEHDVLTGSTNEGTVLAGKTCMNWTSEMAGIFAQVGHSDGLGPSMNPAPPYNSWQSSHENGGCNDTAPRGGAGRLYCFVGP
jgi:hypothetical protein